MDSSKATGLDDGRAVPVHGTLQSYLRERRADADGRRNADCRPLQCSLRRYTHPAAADADGRFGDVTTPAFGYGWAPRLLRERATLEEQGVQPVVGRAGHQQKNVQTTTEVKEVPRDCSRQVEQKISPIPLSRENEQKLGGRILLDGLADGNVVVHRQGPGAPCPPMPMGPQAACCHHLHRMEYGFPAGLQNLGGPCCAPGMSERDMYRAFQAQTMGYVQGYRAGYRDGSPWLGGTIGCPGFLGRRMGTPSPDFAAMLAGSLDDTMTRIHRAQEMMYRAQQVFADSQVAMQNARMSVDWMRARRMP